MASPWKTALVYHLTFVLGSRTLPLVERLSKLVGQENFADAEYQAVFRDLACG